MSYSILGNVGIPYAAVGYTGTSSGSVTADVLGNYTIAGLAAGTYTLTPSLVGYTFSPSNLVATVPVASDAFAGSSLSGSWTTQAGLGSFIVSSGVVKGNTTGVQYAWWNANSLTNDQYCTAVVASLSSNGIGPCVRVSAFGGYMAYYQTGHQYLFKFDGVGGNTLLGSASAPSVNDVVGISAVGTTITVTINGVAVITVTDSTFSSGAAGVWAYQQTTLTSGLKTWAAENVSTFTATNSTGVSTGNSLIATNALLSTGLLVTNYLLVNNALIPATGLINPGDE